VEYSNLGLEWTAATEEYKRAEDEVTELHATLSRIESSIEESRTDALAAEHELSTLRHKIHETESALSRAEHRVEMSKSQIASFIAQRGRDLADMEYLTQETSRVAEQKVRHEEESQILAASIEEKNSVLSGRTMNLESLSQALKEKELSLEETRAGILNAMAESAAEKTTISNLQARLSQIDEQDARGERKRTVTKAPGTHRSLLPRSANSWKSPPESMQPRESVCRLPNGWSRRL
jgi:chromosome segregation ATPase